jgi:hypothetical protein
MNSTPSNATSKPSLVGKVIAQAIAFLVFVIVPTAITLMIPLTGIQFQKSDAGTTAIVNRYVMIFFPWKTERVVNVQKVRADITAEKRYRGTSEERRKGQKGIRFATGQVAIVADGREVIVQAAPELAKDIEAQFNAFVNAETAEPLFFSVYALSYVLGGAATALCAFYVTCVILAIVVFPFRWISSQLISKKAAH